MTGTLTLFNLDQYNSTNTIKSVSDPYWDEIVLDSSGAVEEDGQTTLFYDGSSEAPDPDDYPTRAEYYQAWAEWEKKFPEIAAEIPPKFEKGDRVMIRQRGDITGCVATVLYTNPQGLLKLNIPGNLALFSPGELDLIPHQEPIDRGNNINFRDYSVLYDHNSSVLEKSDDEFIEPDDGNFLEELPPKTNKLHFEEGQIYWHEGRQLKAKIIKIYKSVKKADVYWAGDIFKERILLSELSSLPEQVSATCETPTQPEPETINSENCQPVKSALEQNECVLEESTVNQWVESYYVTRSGSKYWYYRYCYYQRKIKHVHIPGGDTKSTKSQSIKSEVERAIALGKTPEQVKQLIKSA